MEKLNNFGTIPKLTKMEKLNNFGTIPKLTKMNSTSTSRKKYLLPLQSEHLGGYDGKSL